MNGVSTEGSAVMLESMCAVTTGLVVGFIFSWRTMLVALACMPFMMIGGAVEAKFQKGFSETDEKDFKEANLLAGDAINNYRTVASFAYDDRVVSQYAKYLEEPLKSSNKKAHVLGLSMGFSQFVQYAVFATCFYAGARFIAEFGEDSGDVFTAVFGLIFGGFSAGQATAFGPDLNKGKLASEKIFAFIDVASRIDP